MSLAAQLDAVLSNFETNAPSNITGPIIKVNQDFQKEFQPAKAIQVGDSFPPFSLSNALGKEVTFAELIANGPLLITFYRGEWCPYCNLALHAMQKHLEEFQAKGVTLVAISPELPNQSLSTTEKNQLKFPVLSDVQNKLAKQLGILFAQPEAMRPIFKNFGLDFVARNGDDSLEVPLPASFLVGANGVVEPSVALDWVNEL